MNGDGMLGSVLVSLEYCSVTVKLYQKPEPDGFWPVSYLFILAVPFYRILTVFVIFPKDNLTQSIPSCVSPWRQTLQKQKNVSFL